MYGNMYLITELYIARQLNGNIIKTCLEDLQQEVNNQNVEILCYMLTKLTNNCLKNPAQGAGEATKSQFLQVPNATGTKEITLEFVDKVLQTVMELRNHKSLEARIKFKVQDVIDEYNDKWRYQIATQKNKHVDSDGFR